MDVVSVRNIKAWVTIFVRKDWSRMGATGMRSNSGRLGLGIAFDTQRVGINYYYTTSGYEALGTFTHLSQAVVVPKCELI